MLISQTLAKFLKTKRHNNNAMVAMLSLAVKRISQQGDGCYDDMGVKYFNPVNKTMDAIYIIMNRYSSILHYYGPISEEAQRPMLNLIFNKFNVSVDILSERVRVIEFLQSLQDAHDRAFDPFLKQQTIPMIIFVAECDKIHKYFKLGNKK